MFKEPLIKIKNGGEVVEEKEYLYLTEGTILNERYLITEILGERSNFSIVYKGVCKITSTSLVIKEFFPKNLALRDMDKKSVVCKSSSLQKRFNNGISTFRSEGSIMKRVKGKASVLCLDNFDENGTSYIVMKYHEGGDLEKVIKEGLFENYKEFIDKVINPLLDTVNAIHDMGYIHRDIKPSNVIIENGISPILIDFGSAVNISEDEEKDIFVTPGFSPIEFYSEKAKQTKAADIYSINAMIYYYLTGETPPEATNRIIEDTIKKPSEIIGKVPQNLEKLIMKNLSMDAKQRDKNVTAYKTSLRMALQLDKMGNMFGGHYL